MLGLVGADQELRRPELPSWAVHQFMRILPRVDAALAQSRNELTADLIAHAVLQWSVQPTGVDAREAMSLQNDQHVESAYLFAADDVRALHAALGEALKPVAGGPRTGASSPAGPARLSARSTPSAA